MSAHVISLAANELPQRFDYFWNNQGEWVEAPNQRRGGESGVQRLHLPDGRLVYVKRQVGHLYRTLLHPFGRPTIQREVEALVSLKALKVSVPELVFQGWQHDARDGWKALLVTVGLEGYRDLHEWQGSGDWQALPDAVQEQVLYALAGNLARMHRGHWQHGCLYAKHVFIKVSGEGDKARASVALIDLEKCRRRWRADNAARKDMDQLRRRSSFTDAQWTRLLYFYTKAYGSVIKGLEP